MTEMRLRSLLFLSLSLSLLSFFLSFSFSDYLPTYLPIYLSSYLSIYLSSYLSIYVFVYLSIYLSILIHLSICLSIYLSISRSVCLSIYLPVYLQASIPEAILRDFFIFQSWQHKKRSNSAWLPQFLKLTTSKTKQVCETSSFFEVDNIKNETILRDFCSFMNLDNIQNEAILRDVFNFWTWQHQKQKQFCETSFKNRKLSAALTASYQCVLRFFHSTCLKYCACHENLMPGCTKCCTCHAKSSHSANLTDRMLQNATPLRKSAPWPPNISDEHVFCITPATRNASLKILFKCPTPAIVFGNATKPSRFAHFWQGAQSLAPATRKRHLNLQKWLRSMSVFCTFWLRNVLRATTACTISTSQLPKVVRTWCVLHILTSKMCFAPQRRALFHLSSGQMAPHPPL